MTGFRVLVADLLAEPGRAREDGGVFPLDLQFPQAKVQGEARVVVGLRSLTDGIVARGTVSVEVMLVCNRCLTEWTEPLDLPFEQVFRLEPNDVDDELPVERGAFIDLAPVVRDEVALALPLVPLCRDDCRGLCPTCGTDLNIDPCGGHGEEPASPFAVLKQLFDRS